MACCRCPKLVGCWLLRRPLRAPRDVVHACDGCSPPGLECTRRMAKCRRRAWPGAADVAGCARVAQARRPPPAKYVRHASPHRQFLQFWSVISGNSSAALTMSFQLVNDADRASVAAAGRSRRAEVMREAARARSCTWAREVPPGTPIIPITQSRVRRNIDACE